MDGRTPASTGRSDAYVHGILDGTLRRRQSGRRDNPHEVYTWNVAIQRQVTPNLFVSGTYLGSHIAHIWNAIELNPAQFLGLGPCTLQTATGPVSYPVCSTAQNVNQRRLLNLANPQANLNTGGFGEITSLSNGWDSLGRQINLALRLIF